MSSSCNYPCYRNIRHSNHFTTRKPETIEMICFDMDGVLVDAYSSWKHIHDEFQTSNDHSVNAYLRGEITDIEFIQRDLALWKREGKFVHQREIEKILSTIPLMNGAQELIKYLKNHSIQSAIISAGLEPLAKRVANKLGINFVYSNGYQVDTQGFLTGEGTLSVQLMHKEKAIKTLANKLSLSLHNCVAVGNSCFDIPMFEICGLGIAFHASDDCVRKAADQVIEEKDLRKLIPIIQNYFPNGYIETI